VSVPTTIVAIDGLLRSLARRYGRTRGRTSLKT